VELNCGCAAYNGASRLLTALDFGEKAYKPTKVALFRITVVREYLIIQFDVLITPLYSIALVASLLPSSAIKLRFDQIKVHVCRSPRSYRLMLAAVRHSVRI
jgi:hypothetical protein